MSFRTASVIQQFFLDSAMVKNGSMIELAWRISGKFERLVGRGMVLIGELVFSIHVLIKYSLFLFWL